MDILVKLGLEVFGSITSLYKKFPCARRIGKERTLI